MNERKKLKQKLQKDKNEKKELQRRTHMRKELAFLKKTTAAKDIRDDISSRKECFDYFSKRSRNGFL
jgi:hypothetical protein